MINEFDTIVAIATSVSNSGIGIIRISGDQTFSVINEIFRPHNKEVDMRNPESYRMYYGNIVDGQELIDECIVLIMKGPNSYTKEDVAEIDCHGGIYILYRILNLVLKHNVRAAEPGEFTKRAFLNGRIDLTQAEAVMDLIGSKNDFSRKNSLSQLKGRLSECIREIRSEIIYEIAYIESALDDPEHYDLTGYPDRLKENNKRWISILDSMISSYDDGRMISEGIRTCIVGKPNAGKSSLMNTLLGEERAIVTDIAGTTRDTLQEELTMEGITLNIVDTAGIHNTEDKVESIGVERAYREVDEADLILFIMDRAAGLTDEDIMILEKIRGRKKIILLNKSDLSFQQEIFDKNQIYQYIDNDDPVIAISAKYHEGIDEFLSVLKKMVFHGEIDTDHQIYITNARHKKSLDEAAQALSCLETSIEDGMPEDFFTIDLMNAYERLGLMIGEAVEDDLVNEIFSRFCTGK